MAIFLCFIFFLLASSAAGCDRCVHQSKAAYFSQDSVLSSGACGYGSLAVGFNNGRLAAAVPSIYKSGAGCGACIEVRCKDEKLCRKEGTQVIVTDLNTSNETDLVLSIRAFAAMAKRRRSQEIIKQGIVDVEYKRVPCDYQGKNLAIRVEESSQKPYYLAIKVLYQGGQTEIVSMDIATVGASNWASLRRNRGAVWETSRVPEGALQFRFVVTYGYDGKWVWAKSVLPADWSVGVIYDSGVQINDIAQEACSVCDRGDW